MSLILNIDVSGTVGFVSLSDNGKILETISNNEPMNHAGFLQPAIKQLIQKNNYSLKDLAAIGLSNGPGSYTGLRVGLASAKGLAFALNIPLISINSLQLMALAILQDMKGKTGKADILHDTGLLICPMIDARRMEVFFGLFDGQLQTLIEPAAAVIDESFLGTFLQKNSIVFTGNGTGKWQRITNHQNAIFVHEIAVDMAMAELSYKLYLNKYKSDLATVEPFYCKDFYQPTTVG